MNNKKINSYRLLMLGWISLFSTGAQAEEKCQDLLIQFVEPGTAATSLGKNSSRRLTALVPCDNSAGVPTVLHFFERQESRLCVSERTCGNISDWRGYFGLTVGWSDLSLLGDFYLLRHSLRFDNDWNGFQILATFALTAGQLERDCSELSAPTCVFDTK